MNTLFVILTILAVIASVLLVAVVLLQNGKGEGLASNFVAGNQTFGVRQTADMLEKITWGLVTFILVIAISSSFTLGSGSQSSVDTTSDKIEQNLSKEQNSNMQMLPVEQENPAAPTQE